MPKENENSLAEGTVDVHPYGPLRDRGLVERVAATPLSILIAGETGTGKEMLARELHRLSGRGSFIAVNCGALPETLIESMLFGHRKGAFTGAIRDQKGYIEGANGGTLFLDEITEMPVSMQARLLRTVQEREIVRVGDTRPIPVDVRVLSATNRDPQDAVSNGKLREDLYYRLNEFSLLLPPLRERPDDILPLTRLFIEQTARRENAAPATLTPEAGDMLRAASWPGNIRELRSTVRGAFYLAENDGDGRRITPEVLALTPSFLEQEVSPSSASAGDAVPSSSAENEVILSILSRKNVSELRQIFREAQYRAAAHMLETAEGDRPRAAKLLGVSPSSFAAFIRRGEISNSRDPVLAENRCDDPLPSTRDVIPFVRPQRR